MIRGVIVAACLVVAAAASGQTALIEAVARGDAAMDEGRFRAANRAYDEALGLVDPNAEEVLAGLFFRKAHALRGAGEVFVALAAVKRARLHQERDLFADLQSDLQLQASRTVSDAGQIRSALQTARSFGVSGSVPSVDVWVGFEFDSAKLTPEGSRQAEEMGKAMLAAEFERFGFELVGHTDVRGGAEYNLQLSQRRARELRAWLVERLGLVPERLDAKGRGEEEPLADGDSEEAHARNRRVELKLLE